MGPSIPSFGCSHARILLRLVDSPRYRRQLLQDGPLVLQADHGRHLRWGSRSHGGGASIALDTRVPLRHTFPWIISARELLLFGPAQAGIGYGVADQLLPQTHNR